jgi:hypothetical protein
MSESPSILFRNNLKEVGQLIDMHSALGGTGPGRKHNVEILNKSAILFTCAAFEAFIEDLATRSFDHIVAHSKDHTSLPKPILKSIAETLRADKNEIKIWDLAGDGWKIVAENYKRDLLKKYVGPFNTPKPHNIEELLKDLTGFTTTPKVWQWKGMQAASAKDRLKAFVELRGALAHGGKPAKPVLKQKVLGYINLLAPISVRFSNELRIYCHKTTAQFPWTPSQFGSVK